MAGTHEGMQWMGMGDAGKDDVGGLAIHPDCSPDASMVMFAFTCTSHASMSPHLPAAAVGAS